MCPSLPGYSVTQSADHYGDDLDHLPGLDAAALGAWCNANNKCRAFNWNFDLSWGYMKTAGLPVGGSSVPDCFYVKQTGACMGARVSSTCWGARSG